MHGIDTVQANSEDLLAGVVQNIDESADEEFCAAPRRAYGLEGA